MKSSRQIRVFISSTFQDMQAERNHLVKITFPQLRKLCEQRGVIWGEVDLRWGITEEQKSEGQVLPICLAEINRCRPYFIGLLGERYGWIPEEINPALVEQEPWLKENFKRSVTELEILHGVLNNSEMTEKALFYFRDPHFINAYDQSKASQFIETIQQSDIDRWGITVAQQKLEERKEKLSDLKERIRQSGLYLKEGFNDPTQLGNWVFEDLRRIIDELYPEGTQPDPLESEALLHENFAESRARVYVGGEKYFSALDNHIKERKEPLVVLGESGSGKSSLLANWGLRYKNEHPDEVVLLHFIGATENSSAVSEMLTRLLKELKKSFSITDEIPTEEEKLREVFPNWLYKVSVKGKVVLILDGLNQLGDFRGALELNWLPNDFPENVKMILSTLPCRALEVIKERKWPSLIVEDLNSDERVNLVKEYLGLYTKHLSNERIKRIINGAQSKNPLGLRILLDELRQFGEHEKLDLFIDNYLNAKTIPDIFKLILERCERDYEVERSNLVKDALSFIWASRKGLSEIELLDLLGKNGSALPHRIWSPFFLALEQSFINRRGRLDFSHAYIRQAIEEKYLYDEETRNEYHRKLAKYFANFEGTPDRKIEELPWQLSQARLWKRLYDFLSDLENFERLWNLSKFDLMYYWVIIESETNKKRTHAYKQVTDQPELGSSDVRYFLSLMFFEEEDYHQASDLLLKLFESNDFLKFSLQRKVDILEKISWIFELQSDLSQSEKYANLGLDLLKKNGIDFDESTAKLLYDLACVYIDKDDYEKSLEYLTHIIQMAKKEQNLTDEMKDRLSFVLMQKANIFTYSGNFPEAFECYQSALSIAKEIGDFYNILNINSNIGGTYIDIGEYELAEKLLISALDDAQKFGNRDSEAYIYHLLGYLYTINHSGKYSEAVDLLKNAIKIYREIGSDWDISATESELGLAYLALDQNKKAEEFAELGYTHTTDKDLKAYAQYVKAKVFVRIGMDTEAEELFKQAKKQLKKSNIRTWLANCNNDLAILLNKIGRNAESKKIFLETLSLYKEMNLDYHIKETQKTAHSLQIEI